jgi:hypothetical protein
MKGATGGIPAMLSPVVFSNGKRDPKLQRLFLPRPVRTTSQFRSGDEGSNLPLPPCDSSQRNRSPPVAHSNPETRGHPLSFSLTAALRARRRTNSPADPPLRPRPGEQPKTGAFQSNCLTFDTSYERDALLQSSIATAQGASYAGETKKSQKLHFLIRNWSVICSTSARSSGLSQQPSDQTH